jgi:hypothetical protein
MRYGTNTMSTYQFMKIHQHHFHLQPYLDPAVVGMSMILDKYLPFDFSGIKLFKAWLASFQMFSGKTLSFKLILRNVCLYKQPNM